jgi:hypothetical protein
MYLNSIKGFSMKVSILTSVLASVLILSGCSSAPKSTWKKAGISQHDTHNAIQKCRYQIGIAKVESEREKSLFGSCMESEGYRYTNRRVS